MRRYRMTLYEDSARRHKGAPVAQFLRTRPRLNLQYLPPYQPGLNMQERIWKRIRCEATTNRWFETLRQLHATVRRTTRASSLQSVQRLCSST